MEHISKITDEKVLEKKGEIFSSDIEDNLEDLSVAIAKISRGMEVLSKSRMKKKTILLLLSRTSGISQRDVSAVLDSLTSLKAEYLK